jgi:polysaccharide biosynthesis transport protein
MAALTRNYQISQENYRSLLDKELAAGLATQMERSQKSERFTVMDPARVPEKPFKPKRLMLEAVGSLGGLIVGALLGIGLEWRKKQLMGEWELPPEIMILGRVPRIQLPAKPIVFHQAGSALVLLVVCGAILGQAWRLGSALLKG